MKTTNLKNDFSDMDFQKMNKAIVKHFHGKTFNSNQGKICFDTMRFAYYENTFGLPYTSTSSCAGLWVTNIEMYFDLEQVYKYEGFAMTNEGEPVAILWDNSSPENELLIKL